MLGVTQHAAWCTLTGKWSYASPEGQQDRSLTFQDHAVLPHTALALGSSLLVHFALIWEG